LAKVELWKGLFLARNNDGIAYIWWHCGSRLHAHANAHSLLTKTHTIDGKHECIHMFTVFTVNILYREHMCAVCMHVHPFSGGARVSAHPSHSMRLERLTLWLAGARAKAILSVWYLYMCLCICEHGPCVCVSTSASWCVCVRNETADAA